MDEPESFVFYPTFYEQINDLDDATQLRFYRAIAVYGTTGKTPDFKGLELAAWIPIKNAIDNAKSRRKQNTTNGKKGGKPKTEPNQTIPNVTDSNRTEPTQTDSNRTKPTPNLNVNVNVNGNGNVNGNVNTQEAPSGAPCEQPAAPEDTKKQEKSVSHRFQKPTRDELQAYITEKGYHFSPDEFIAHYESNGWRVGAHSPMKDWKATCTTWHLREKDFAPAHYGGKYPAIGMNGDKDQVDKKVLAWPETL